MPPAKGVGSLIGMTNITELLFYSVKKCHNRGIRGQECNKESNQLCLGLAGEGGTDYKGFTKEETNLRLKELAGVCRQWKLCLKVLKDLNPIFNCSYNKKYLFHK